MYSNADRCVIGVDSLFKEFGAVTSFSPLFLFWLIFSAFLLFTFPLSFISGSFVTASIKVFLLLLNYVLLLLLK